MKKFPLGDIHDFSTEEVQKLLHNRFVVILGDSIQRTIYKDLVRFLQNEGLLTFSELTFKGPGNFWNDHLVEGGPIHNDVTYREVRQYRTDHHLVRVYFITRVYSDYVETILQDFEAGPLPDLVILNSCLWDLNRDKSSSNEPHLRKAFRKYRKNLETLFSKLHSILPTSCLIIWNTTMPIGRKIKGAYLQPGMKNKASPEDILRANFEGAVMACSWQFDVLDLNYCFRFLEEYRAKDGVHWNMWVHRCVTKLLLTHVARAWGVNLKEKHPLNGIPWNGNASQHLLPQYPPQPPLPLPPACFPPPPHPYIDSLPFAPFTPSHDPNFQHDANYQGSSGFLNFEDNLELPAHPEETQYGSFHGPTDSGGLGLPAPFPVGQEPGAAWAVSLPYPVHYAPNEWERGFPPGPRRSPRGFRGRQYNGRVMRQRRFYGQHYSPYSYPPDGAGGPPPFQGPPYLGSRGW